MTIQEVVARFQKSELGTVKVDTMLQGVARWGCAALELKTSDFEARGLAEAFMDLSIKTGAYFTALCHEGNVTFRIIHTTNHSSEVAWAREQELAAAEIPSEVA